MRKNFLFAAVAAICVLGSGGAVFAADSTADLISSLRARGFNDNEIAVYKSQHPDQFVTTTATPGTATSVGVVTRPANVTYAMNAVTARAATQANASAVLAGLKKNGYNLQELILYMKQHPEIFPPNVDPNTKRLVTAATPNTTKVKQVTPVKAVTTTAPVVTKPQVLPAAGSSVATATGLTTAASSGTPAVMAINQSLQTVAQLRQRGFNDMEIKNYYSTH